MAYFKFLIWVSFAASSFSASATYVNLKPPPGWSQGGSAVAGAAQGIFTQANAAASTSMLLGRIGANAALTVAGSEAAIPVGLRLAAGAGAVAAEFAFANPYLFVGGIAVSAAIAWFDNKNFVSQGGIWKKRSESIVQCNPTCYTYVARHSWGPGYESPSFPTALAAAQNACANVESLPGGLGACTGLVVEVSETGWHNDTYRYTGNIIKTEKPDQTTKSTVFNPVPLPEFVATMQPEKIPDLVFKGFPGYVEWPVDVPYINPDTGDESTSFGRPFVIPTGLPVPTSDPSVYNQPAVRVIPAGTLSAPWRVDITPVDIPQTGSTPKTIDQLNPKSTGAIDPVTGKPVVVATNTGTPSSDKPPGLCEQFPDILACQKPVLDTPDVPDLETKDIPISIIPALGWGAGNASCPAPRHLVGANVDMPFTMVCDFMNGLRPILIAIAWLSAAFILLGMKSGAD